MLMLEVRRYVSKNKNIYAWNSLNSVKHKVKNYALKNLILNWESEIMSEKIRQGEIKRHTKETKIDLKLLLDAGQNRNISSGIGFFDHMLNLICAHGFMDIDLKCEGDIEVDAHHSVEDIGIAFGQALSKSLGDKAGIKRYAHVYLPMDESLAFVALDLSNRAYLHYDVDIAASTMVGQMEAQLFEEFFRAIAQHAGITLHIRLIYGKNTHHIIEAICKGFGRALADAVSYDPRTKGALPSTKGAI